MLLFDRWQEFGATRHTENHVRSEQTGRTAVGRSEQGLHDEPEQVASGGLARQGALLPRRDDRRQRSHTEQLEQKRQENKSLR